MTSCQYCNTLLEKVERKIYSENDVIWKCPNCTASVTLYAKEPGVAVLKSLGQLRAKLYPFVKSIKSIQQYMKLNYNTISLTRISDEQLVVLHDKVQRALKRPLSLDKVHREDIKRLNQEFAVSPPPAVPTPG